MAFLWPNDDGWPYPDSPDEAAALTETLDDDLVTLHAAAPHLLDELDPLERQVLSARFGLDGATTRSMKELHADLGVTRGELRDAMASGLSKLRSTLG